MTHTKPPQNFPLQNTLKLLRSKRNYTQKQVADRLGVSPVTVSGWEIGNRTPEPQMLPKIAAIYGVTVDNLLGHSTKASSILVGEVIFVPIYGSVIVQEGRLAFLDYQGNYPVPLESATRSRTIQPVLLHILDDAMATAGIRSGSMILVQVDAPLRPGDICMLSLGGAAACPLYCCRVDSDTITVKAADPQSPPVTYATKDPNRAKVVGPCIATYNMLPRGMIQDNTSAPAE
jgi:transcriptional regulator with XRE-family HTH domain